MRVLRFLVLLAVALAVPLQGAAAVAAGQCMAFGHHETGPGMSHEAHDHQGHQAEHQHDHHAPEGQDHRDASADHCAPCVACCAAAAISTPFQPFIADPLQHSVASLTGKSFSGIAPETLDRPPLAL